ncbi:hypothetical protein [Aureicoccus marinus]|uniref:Tetratricopeptide repeat protein n=1 Tax=Aureicoccus marinus TaxID=754435 RepID=A0A2S7T953_9FLAO|nr:hypothetical protein [Aureicoccus marinus]PQJ16047.1 hypothetical protein BST99_10205 [Aureicoccus marinus]
MKKLLPLFFVLAISFTQAQDKSALAAHFEAYYQAMKSQGDVNGVINSLTHLNVLSPSQERIDTLGYIYMNSGQHEQALRTVGIENDDKASDLAVQVKAVSLKAINQPKRAQEQFEILFSRNANAYLAYELADLMIQNGDNTKAAEKIEYGLANAPADMKYAFFERQQPYEVSIKAAFLHLKGLLTYNNAPDKIDDALALVNQALQMEPKFNLASLSRQALESRKAEANKQ